MPWLQIVLECAADDADRLSDRLSAAGAEAVTFVDSADQPLFEPPLGTVPLWNNTRVIGLFDAHADTDAVLTSIAAAESPAPLPPARVEQLEDRDWSREWMDNFKPMRFGTRLWIVPSWHSAPDPDGVNILLDPGLAFGTGTHPTTRLCLQWLDQTLLGGKTVVDYGCGSGILAIAAALLGATKVWAVDNDPQALLATRDNAVNNNISERIEISAPETFQSVKADVLVANILALPLLELAPRFAQLVVDGGAIALSGILPEQAQQVAEAYAPWFDMAPAEIADDWVRLNGIRRTGSN